MKPVIEIKNLVTQFGGMVVHDQLNLTIHSNRIIVLIGDSGCGKTTLVREILMLQQVTSGSILLAGEDILTFDLESQITRQKLSRLGVMFQKCALFSSLTVLENVMFPLKEYTDYSVNMIQELAVFKLQLAGLNPNAYNLYPTEISGGMLKRVALARALALDPEVVFLDEPTSGLDPNSSRRFDKLISQLQQQMNLTFIIITHDINTIEHIANEVVYLGSRKVLFHGDAKDAITSKIPQLYEYFHGI